MRANTCKHFNGIQNKECDAQIKYDLFRCDGVSLLKTLPCMNPCLPCVKREYPTDAELKAFEAETEKLMGNVLLWDAAVSSGAKCGEFTCSICGSQVRWMLSGPLAGMASCQGCDWSAVS